MSARSRASAQPAWFRASKPASADRDRWTVSYIDILTILLVLFVAAAARSVAQTSVKPPTPEAPLAESLRRLRARGLDARLTSVGLIVSLPQAVLFESGTEEIGPAATPLIEIVVDVLNDLPNRVRLAGYADSVPIRGGRFHDNWELAAARGLSLLNVLSQSYGIAESRLSVESFGSQSPHDSNDTLEGRAANRRVEILVLN